MVSNELMDTVPMKIFLFKFNDLPKIDIIPIKKLLIKFNNLSLKKRLIIALVLSIPISIILIIVNKMISDMGKYIASHGYAFIIFSVVFVLCLIIIMVAWIKIENTKKRKNEQIAKEIQEWEEQIERERQEKAEKLERERLEEAEKEQQNLEKRTVFFAKRFLPYFINILTECLVIDSNIWMNDKYDNFFDVLRYVCKEQDYKMKLFGPQFDEIVNIKKKTEYGEEKNKRSRIAINRIEKYQKENLLDITPVSIDAKHDAYADPLIVKFLKSEVGKGVESTFISNDIELRIRVRQHLKDINDTNWKIVEMDDVLPGCDRVIDSLKYQTISELLK